MAAGDYTQAVHPPMKLLDQRLQATSLCLARHESHFAGGPIIAAAVLLVASAFRLFQKAKTPVPTYRTPTALVTDGVYGISRNPIYLAMVLLMIGLAVTLDNIWLLALAAIFQQIIRWGVIAREERYLETNFGQEYSTFKQRTRRWI